MRQDFLRSGSARDWPEIVALLAHADDAAFVGGIVMRYWSDQTLWRIPALIRKYLASMGFRTPAPDA